MSSNLISIASSGLKAARAALDVTSQNIANASTDGYVRRSVNLTEVSGSSSRYASVDISQYGVVVSGITRNADTFLQGEVRRTNSDASRADTLVSGLTDLSNAVENSGVYSAITSYQSALSKLTASPTDSSLRANALESAKTMAQTFNLASSSISAVQSSQQDAASSGVSELNTLAQSLAELNKRISSNSSPDINGASLLDQRDSILQKMSTLGNITTTFDSSGAATVTLGGTSSGSGGQTLVTAGTASTLSMATATDGTISFSMGGTALTLSGGSLAANQQTLSQTASALTTLDGIASSLISTVNTAQTSGVDLNGTTGSAMFSGTTAADMAVVLTSGSQIATAPSGSVAGSQVATNLTALQSALSSTDIAGQTNDLLFSLASAVSSNTTTRDALDTIATNAKTSLSAESGVDLDTEAANLVRYQQAYQASGKVISISSTLFDQLLNL